MQYSSAFHRTTFNENISMLSNFLHEESLVSIAFKSMNIRRVAHALGEKVGLVSSFSQDNAAEEIHSQIDKARDGSLEDLASVAKILCDNLKVPLPFNVLENIVSLASKYLSKDPPSEGDYSGPALRMGKFACHSFIAMQCVHSHARLIPFGFGFEKVWPQAFSWTYYLHSFIRHVHQHRSDSSETADNSELSIHFAESIAAFMKISASWTFLYETHFHRDDIFDFIVAFWATKDVPREISDRATEVLTVQLEISPESRQLYILESMLSHFESPQATVALMMDRTRVAQFKMGCEAMKIHCDLLSLLIHREIAHPISNGILSETPVAFVLASLSSVLEARDWSFNDRQHLVKICLRIVRSIYTYAGSGKHFIVAQALDCGLVEALYKIGQEFTDSLEDASLICDDIIPLSVISKAVYRAAYRGFLDFSRKLGNQPFNLLSLQGRFGSSWNNLEIRMLELVVLQHMYARGIHTELVYCNNVRLPVFRANIVYANVVYNKVVVSH